MTCQLGKTVLVKKMIDLTLNPTPTPDKQRLGLKPGSMVAENRRSKPQSGTMNISRGANTFNCSSGIAMRSRIDRRR